MATESKDVPVKSGKDAQTSYPITSLRQEVDRLFDSFMTGRSGFGRWMDTAPFMSFPQPRFALSPDVDFSETDGGYKISAELPGLDEKDIELTLSDNVLMLKGEKKEEREEKDKGYYLSERSYGTFQRAFRLPNDVDATKIDTKFSKGVLTVNLPKSAEAKAKTRKIEVKPA